MSDRWLGIKATSNGIVIVGIAFTEANPEVFLDKTWDLLDGPRPEAYNFMYKRLQNYLQENNINRVVVQGALSIVSKRILPFLEASELRGVVLSCIAHVGIPCTQIAKNKMSQMYGERDIATYVSDDDYWENLHLPVKKTRREVAMLILTERQRNVI